MECSPLYQRFLILIHMFLYWSLETCNFFFVLIDPSYLYGKFH